MESMLPVLRHIACYSLLASSLTACANSSDSRAEERSDREHSAALAAVRDTGALIQAPGSASCPWDSHTDGRAAAAEIRNAEARRLASTEGRIARLGDTLVVRLLNGGEERLIDCLLSADRYARYQYLGMGPGDRGMIFGVSQYESNNPFWMDDSSGTTVVLASMPEYSPDSTHLAVANSDLEAGYTRNVFEIFRIRGRRLERVFEADGKDEWGASRINWISPDAVQFTRSRLVAFEAVDDTLPVRVVLRNGTWQPEEH
jgi:hypothetical protein